MTDIVELAEIKSYEDAIPGTILMRGRPERYEDGYNQMFDVGTPEKLRETILFLVDEMRRDGRLDPLDYEYEEPLVPVMAEADIEKLPTSQLRDTARRDIRRNTEIVALNKKRRERREQTQLALSGNADAALWIIRDLASDGNDMDRIFLAHLTRTTG